jgi:hypothetical protein
MAAAGALGCYTIYSLNQHSGQGCKVEVEPDKGKSILSLNPIC